MAASPIPEELKTLAEFCPDGPARLRLHYHFAHRFLVQYVHHNPFNFLLHDGVDPTRFIQARWALIEQQIAGPQSLPVHRLFRRVTDLEAYTEEVAGHPALFVQLPVPEIHTQAFFVAAVLKVTTDVFRKVEESTLKYVRGGAVGVRPPESDPTPIIAAGVRFFTLERTATYEGEQALKLGRFCEWTAAPEHLNSGLGVPVTREKFSHIVARAIQHGDRIPAVASHMKGGEPSRPTTTVCIFYPPMLGKTGGNSGETST